MSRPDDEFLAIERSFRSVGSHGSEFSDASK